MVLAIVVKDISEEQRVAFMDGKETSVTGVVTMMGARDEWIEEMSVKAEKYENLIAEHPELLEDEDDG